MRPSCSHPLVPTNSLRNTLAGHLPPLTLGTHSCHTLHTPPATHSHPHAPQETTFFCTLLALNTPIQALCAAPVQSPQNQRCCKSASTAAAPGSRSPTPIHHCLRRSLVHCCQTPALLPQQQQPPLPLQQRGPWRVDGWHCCCGCCRCCQHSATAPAYHKRSTQLIEGGLHHQHGHLNVLVSMSDWSAVRCMRLVPQYQFRASVN